jgi:hypothetical protein
MSLLPAIAFLRSPPLFSIQLVLLLSHFYNSQEVAGGSSDAMIRVLESIPPHPVASMDHTFKTNKKTTVHEPGPPPEHRSDATRAVKARHVAAAENATLFTMGANGQVSHT